MRMFSFLFLCLHGCMVLAGNSKDGISSKGSLTQHPVSPGLMTLAEAVETTLARNPALGAQHHETQARQFETQQAGALPNPSLDFEIEEFAGSDARSGFGDSVTSVSISQPLLLSGKRQKARQIAALKADLSNWDLAALRLQLVAEVRKAFTLTLAAQQKATLANELLKLSQQTHEHVLARVNAGKVSPLEEMKSQVALSQATMSFNQARLAVETARQRLLAFWGHGAPAFEALSGSLTPLSSPPSLQSLLKALPENPALARWSTEHRHQSENLNLQLAQRAPDVSLMVGVQHFADNSENTIRVGFSLPLKVFNKNQGNIQAARKRVEVAEQTALASRLELKAALHQVYQLFQSAHMSADMLKDNIIPAAEQSFEATTIGYREGKFGLLEVLDAQRTLFQSKLELTEVLVAYHTHLAELERLAGIEIEKLTVLKRKVAHE